MSAADELARALRDLGSSIGNASTDLSTASRNASVKVNGLQGALKALADTGRNTYTALTDSDSTFTKFDGAITSASVAIQRLGGTSQRFGGAIRVLTQGIEKALKAATEYNEKLVNFYDGASDFAVTVGFTTDQFLKLAHTAGYTLESSKDFNKLLSETNESLTALGPTTYAGAKRLANIFANFNVGETQLEFLKLGYGPKELNKVQTQYIKSMSMAGLQLSSNDAVVRESSLQYARALNKLSMITGEKRDSLAQEIAEQRADVKYQLKIQQLVESGNTKAIEAFDMATATVGKTLGKDFSAALRDFVANGTATTKQGEMLMFKTQGRIAAWVKDVEAGRMDPVELSKRIAKAEYDFTTSNREALTFSEQFASDMSTSGESFSQAAKLMNVRSEEELNKMMTESASKQDDIKNTQDLQLRTERITGIAFDELRAMVSGPANSVLLGLVTLATQLSRGIVKLALMLPIEGTQLEGSLQKLELILSGQEQLGEAKSKIDTRVQEIDSELNKRLENAKKLEQSQKELREAEERQPKLEKESKEQPNADVLREQAKNNEILIEKKKREIEALKKREKELEEKRTKKQLEEERRRLIQRREEVIKEEKAKPSPTPPKPVTPSPDKNPPHEPPKPGEDKQVGENERMYPPRLGMIKTKDGKVKASVDARFVSKFQAFIDEIEATGYKIRRIDGHVDKISYDRRGKPFRSAHAYGLAIDVNPLENWGNKYTGKYGEVMTDMPDYFQEISKKHGLGWGHKWTGDYQDSMHFSGIPAEGGRLVKGKGYKRGGVVIGPDAGYPVTLHGTEAIVPINGKPIPVKISGQLKELQNKPKDSDKLVDAANNFASEIMSERTSKVDLNSQNFTKNFNEITQTIKAKVYNFKQNMDKNKEEELDSNLATLAIDKLESMISSVERSNSIHHDLKMYMRN